MSYSKTFERLSEYKEVLVVGASRGIGEALAVSLGEQNRRIYVTARERKSLQAFETMGNAADYQPYSLDMTKPANRLSMARHIEAHSGYLDLVVINAGTCEYMDSDRLDLDLVDRVMDTNFKGVVAMIDTVMPLLRAARELHPERQPKLVVLSSSVTYQALPRAHAYGASKAALRYFLECLKIDLQHEHIDVQIVSPGFVDTPLTQQNDFPMPMLMSAEEAAQRIIKGMASRRFDIQFPRRFTCMLKLFHHLPEGLRFKLLGKMSRHPERLKTA